MADRYAGMCNAELKAALTGWEDYWFCDYRHQLDPFWRNGYNAGWDAAAHNESAPEPWGMN